MKKLEGYSELIYYELLKLETPPQVNVGASNAQLVNKNQVEVIEGNEYI